MPSSADLSVQSVLDTIQQKYPGVPFLALGQTALWDEPTKAVWRHLLDTIYPAAQLIAGVHDTDYFAKTTAHLGSDRKYATLPHDDGRTRDLWSAAGEMSALFGSESVPTRAFFEKHGVPFDSLARDFPGGKDAFYREYTAAWGWRGIVSTESHDLIAHDIPMRDIQDALLEQIDWAITESMACLDEASREHAMRAAAQVRCMVTAFLAECDTHCRLSDLYQTLLPQLYELLLGASPAHFSTTASSQLFVFHPQSCLLPRFGLLAHFLNPSTRRTACNAYNASVSGSGIYTLDHFGEGAVPFDVVVPGKGRGTLRLTPQGIVIETQPAATVLPGQADTPDALARLLQSAFGENVLLVGKAVTLVDMLASEYLVVFHETASGYTDRTHAMNKRLRADGMALDLRPIVRLAYPTWDALSMLPETIVFQLPPHLASAFGRDTIAAPHFAHEWHGVVEQQRETLQTLRHLHKTRDLMHYLETEDNDKWRKRQTDYEDALRALKEVAAKSDTLAGRIDEHQQQWDMWKIERQRLERRKGDDWRANLQPLREKIHNAVVCGEATETIQRDIDRQTAIRATAFDEPLAQCAERIQATRALIAEFRRQRRLLERGPQAKQARATIDSIMREAQMARMTLLRNAFLTIDSLEHTNVRPTAWWLPLVDPTRAWFNAIASGTQARLEEL